MSEGTYTQKGFGLKAVIAGSLQRDWHSALVDRVKARGFRVATPEVTIRLAEEFGFCYGVDRAVEYAYETLEKFPGRRVTLLGEIIHNPHVNDRLRRMGVRILPPDAVGSDAATQFGPGDIVIIPAFGVPAPVFDVLRSTGCVLVDTTCGSVLNVWKNVEKYARDGFTSVIHGKWAHEETRATASRALRHPGGQYLIVRDMEEAEIAGAYVRRGGDREAFLRRFRDAISPGFDPDRHLERLGVANQTTMLSSESLAIAEALGRALRDRWGEEAGERFRSFDTICSATQDRQDAVLKLVKEPLDLMLVIGGYNSSNTNHLVDIAGESTRAFHIDSPDGILDADRIRHKPAGAGAETVTEGWLPKRPCTVGVTAGASTPNNKIGEVIERVLALRGVTLEQAGLAGPAPAGA